MSDPAQSNSEDNFSFVDKRRVVDAPDPIEGSGDVSFRTGASEDPTSEETPSEQKQSSIYDVAAYCMGLLITEGFQRLGLIADPQTGKAIEDLPSARVAIDCVVALVTVLDEPASTLPEPVKREMKRTLNDLRLNYIDRTRS